MNVRCPDCDRLYRVDPDRLPAAGVRTRCEACGTVFQVDGNGAVTAERSAPAAGVGPAASAPAPSGPAAPPPEAPAQPPPSPPSAPAAQAPGGGGQERASGAPVFGPQDPDTRAKRLARALVSDIVVYNPDRRAKSLEAGTLRADFREEVLKSWEEYVEQVGEEMAKKTPFFRDALNEILAKGQKVF